MFSYVVSVLRSFIASRNFRLNQIVFVKEQGPGLIINKRGVLRRHCLVHQYEPNRWVNTPYHLLRGVTDQELDQFFQSCSDFLVTHPEFVGAVAFDDKGSAVGVIN